jgi:pimeloyl-ACP methyl ester carboxylesterase
VPRIIGILILNKLGIHWFDGLPTIAFARRPNTNEVPTYSLHLQTNFRPHSDFRDDVRNARRPLTVLVGEADDEMIAAAYAPAVHSVNPDFPVRVLPGLGHMAMTTDPAAVEAIVAALGQGQ